MRLQDKVVLVTASTRGIGLACVKKCVSEGACVYMAARNLQRAQEIADKHKRLPDSWGRVFRSQPAEVQWWRRVPRKIIGKAYPEMELND